MDIVKMLAEMFKDRLLLEEIYLGIIFAVVGLSIAMLAKRITRALKRRNNITNDDKLLIFIKVVGLLFIFSALIVLIIKLS